MEEILTENKKRKHAFADEVRAEYQQLMARPGAMKTAVYKALASRYGVAERTIVNYVKVKKV